MSGAVRDGAGRAPVRTGSGAVGVGGERAMRGEGWFVPTGAYVFDERRRESVRANGVWELFRRTAFTVTRLRVEGGRTSRVPPLACRAGSPGPRAGLNRMHRPPEVSSARLRF
ncbi:hypothetical protein GCM10010439_22120 [Actinocorallia aurantiaca]|uniref:Uncharacterized protein n=1 Tax=Actinocorallia aurantiaca TaxID=46204 RepID=A0ABN3U5J0_9ACTN